MKMSEHYTKRIISHEEAREIAQRLINSHFRREPYARVSIPAKVDYDDDLLIMAYIYQMQEALTGSVAEQSAQEQTGKTTFGVGLVTHTHTPKQGDVVKLTLREDEREAQARTTYSDREGNIHQSGDGGIDDPQRR